MKKKFVLSFLIILSVMIVGALCACQSVDGNNTVEKEKQISSLSADLSALTDISYEIGAFDVGKVILKVNYDDGTSDSFPVTENMLTEESKSKLNISGTHLITVVYRNRNAKFSVTLTDPQKIYHIITLYGGYVSAVNNKTVISPVKPKNGESVVANYEDGDVITLTWEQENGKHFTYWTANDAKIGTDSIISVTVKNDVVYRAHSEPVVYTVYFNTFCDQFVSSRTTDVLTENDIATDEGSQIKKDGFVFSGWTTDTITEEQSLSGYDKNIVKFPYSVTRNIQFYAVWIPQGIIYEKTEDGYAVIGFEGNIRKVDIPSVYCGEEVVEIRETAFNSAAGRKITEITIPSTVKTIEDRTFAGCAHLRNITVDSSSENFCSEDGILFNKDKTELRAYPSGKVTAVYSVPSSVTEIAPYAFYNALVGGIVLNSDVNKIGISAFDSVHTDYIDMSEIKPLGLRLGENENGRRERVFNENLNKLRLSEATKISFFDFIQIEEIKDKIITSESDLTDIRIFKYIETDGYTSETLYRIIKNPYFEYQGDAAEIIGVSREITNATLQIRFGDYYMKSIGYKAYADCCYLEKVNIPQGTKMERICDDAFSDTPWINTKTDFSIATDLVLYKYFGTKESFKLASTVEKIAEGAFANNSHIKYLDIEDNAALKSIEAYGFYNCVNFKGFKCTPNPSGEGLYLKNAVKKIGAYSFTGTEISYIKLQTAAEIYNINLSEIGEYAFSECNYLKSVELAGATTEIENNSFFNSISIEKFILSEYNPIFEVNDGILYRKNANDDYTLFTYPAGRTDTVFDPSNVRAFVSELEVDEKKYLDGEDYSIGKTVVNGLTHELFMVTKNPRTEFEGKANDNKIIFRNGKSYLKDTTQYYVEEDGTEVYDGDKYYYYLENGIKTVLIYDNETDSYYINKTLNVTSFGQYSLYYANIAALFVPTTVKAISENSVNIPGLIYVEFEDNPVSTYQSMFSRFAPQYVVMNETVSLSGAAREYYGRDEDLFAEKNKTFVSHTFFYDYDQKNNSYDKNVVYALSGETLYIVKTSRTVGDIVINENIKELNKDGTITSYSDDKTALPYSFYGYYAESVKLRKVGTLDDYVFSDAYNLTKLYIECGFINEITELSFGNKLNNDLFIYDYLNDVDMYASKWKLETFMYKNQEGEDFYASKYLISSENGAMAIILYEDENGNDVTLDIVYDTVSEEKVMNMQNEVKDAKPGYDIDSWIDENNNTITLKNGIYNIPYNQVLRCNWKPQKYKVYLTVSPSVVMDLEIVEIGVDGAVTYTTEVEYSKPYEFTISENTNGRKLYWMNESLGVKVKNSDTQWLVPCDEEIRLNALFCYTVKTEESAEYTTENTDYEVFFGEAFNFDVPIKTDETDDRVFDGWCLVTDGNPITITDANGNGFENWNFTDKNEYTIRAIWR